MFNLPTLTPTQQTIVNNLVELQYVEGDAFTIAYEWFLEDESNFTIAEIEYISMYYGWN